MALTINYDGTGIVAYADGQTTDNGSGHGLLRSSQSICLQY